MFIIYKSCQVIGSDNTAYLLNTIANFGWMAGVMFGTEDTRINYLFMGLTRGIFTVVLFVFLAKINNIPYHFPDKYEFGLLCRRNVLMTLHGFALTLSMHYLEVPICYTIHNCGPIIVFILDYFMNGAKITQRQLIGIALSTVGALLVINSHLLYALLDIPYNLHSNFQYADSRLQTKIMVSIGFLIVMVGWAYAITITKKFKIMTSTHVNIHLGLLLVFFNSFGLMVKPIPSPLTFQIMFYCFLWAGIPMAVSSGVYILSLFYTKKSGNIAIMSLVSVVVGYAISMFRYDETPNKFAVVGSIAIGIGLFLTVIQ